MAPLSTTHQPERRSDFRKRVLKSGTIEFSGAGAISCVVRNQTLTGACLEFESPIGIPDRFALKISDDAARYECIVIWRRSNRVGVRFDWSK